MLDSDWSEALTVVPAVWCILMRIIIDFVRRRTEYILNFWKESPFVTVRRKAV